MHLCLEGGSEQSGAAEPGSAGWAKFAVTSNAEKPYLDQVAASCCCQECDLLKLEMEITTWMSGMRAAELLHS